MTLDEFVQLEKIYPKDLEALQKAYPDDMEIVDYFMDHGIVFECPNEALLEARIHQHDEGNMLAGYPGIEIGDYKGKTCITLLSAYGFGEENEIFCEYAVIGHI